MTPGFLAAFNALPRGTFTGRAQGCRYVVSRVDFAGGTSAKLVAHELGGPDCISLDLYRLASGARLRLCKMPRAKVEAFVLSLVPDAPDG